MKIDIYKSTKNGNKYLSVPAGIDVEKFVFPKDVDSDILTLSPFKTSLDISSNDNRIALDSHQVIDDIKQKGFSIHGAKIEVTIMTAKWKPIINSWTNQEIGDK